MVVVRTVLMTIELRQSQRKWQATGISHSLGFRRSKLLALLNSVAIVVSTYPKLQLTSSA